MLRLRAVADPGFMDRGADILLSPPTLPLLLSSLLLPLILPLFFLDVQARRGAGAPPAPTLDPPLLMHVGYAYICGPIPIARLGQ